MESGSDPGAASSGPVVREGPSAWVPDPTFWNLPVPSDAQTLDPAVTAAEA